jgi:Domain of unknown function (DUF5667)/Domain of unknown function (DUF5666)
MNSVDEIYDKALTMLKKGHSKEEVLVKFAQFKNELAPLLEISSALLLVPKNIVPMPLMRRKYAAVPVKRFWLAWLHVSKFAGASAAVMLLASALSVTAYQASTSIPGSPLFALKKGGENLQLILALSQTKKASLQISIAQQRLSDAQEIFNNPSSNTDQKTAALNELSAQTASAVAEVNTVAIADPKSAASNPMLNSLDSLTNQQKNLLTGIKPDSQIKTAQNSALAALGNDTAKLSAIKQTIAVASNDQSALAKLSSDPNSVAAFGQISQATTSKITVEQITFSINSQTIIKDNSGQTLLPSELKNGDKASVVGEKISNLLLAQQIFITGSSASSTNIAATATTTGEVKSALTQTPNITAASSTTSEAEFKKPDNQTSTTTTVNPNNASVHTIFEDPRPQFAN